MDQNRDGFIDKNDLRDTFAALGSQKKDKKIKQVGCKVPFLIHLVCVSRTFKCEAGGAG